jgi:hypothetical protein
MYFQEVHGLHSQDVKPTKQSNRWWAESDMDAEDLAKAGLKGIDDWLEEEIVGFDPEFS